jgi:hypothetical protein
MQILKLSRTTPEQIVMPMTNVDARSLTTGWPVAFRLGTAASLNFNNAVLALSGTNGDLYGFLGVADQDIATNAVGRVVIWGYARSVYLSATNTSVTVAAADPLIPGVSGFMSAALAGITVASCGLKYVIASNVPVTLSAAINTVWASGFVKGGL